MLLTCPQCQTQYKLSPDVLGTGGNVRCTACAHVWFQPAAPDYAEVSPPLETVAQEVPSAVPEPLSAAPVLEQVTDVEPPPPSMPPESPAVPEAVLPTPAVFKVPEVAYRPMNMSEKQFGVLVFLSCVFVTFSVLFLFKGVISRHVPAMVYLYESLGMHIQAPGEGFRLSDLTAEERIGKKNRSLVVEAKLMNMANQRALAPVFAVELRDADGKPIKEWEWRTPEAKELASGETLPLKLEFGDVPEGGAHVSLRVEK